MGRPKQRKDAKRCPDASRSPLLTTVFIKRRKPASKITLRGECLTSRIVVIFLIHSCMYLEKSLNMAEMTMGDSSLGLFRFGRTGLSGHAWQNYLKIKGTQFSNKDSQCILGSRMSLKSQGVGKTASRDKFTE